MDRKMAMGVFKLKNKLTLQRVTSLVPLEIGSRKGSFVYGEDKNAFLDPLRSIHSPNSSIGVLPAHQSKCGCIPTKNTLFSENTRLKPFDTLG